MEVWEVIIGLDFLFEIMFQQSSSDTSKQAAAVVLKEILTILPLTNRHRRALTPISVISDIGLSLISELPISELPISD
jgi:hypothetical protein